MNIELKSTGMLVDELITTELRIKNIGDKEEFRHRQNLLTTAIENRLQIDDTSEFELLKSKLTDISAKCWNEQEILMQYNKIVWPTSEDNYNCAQAAIETQKLNARRNAVIREIDTLLGEAESTQPAKSYA